MRRLVEKGDGAVVELARAARSAPKLTTRLIAVELLGKIGTRPAVDALLDHLTAEKHLAVRNQLCIQLGYAREDRAVPILIAWLKTIGPRAIDDVGNQPKESQPSTCYLRHVEALAMIGDPSALPALSEFKTKIPRGVGFGGFISNMLVEGVDEATELIQTKAAFWAAVRKQPGLEGQLKPVFAHLRNDALARLRMQEDQVMRRTPAGRQVLERLAQLSDATVASSAKALLAAWNELGQ